MENDLAGFQQGKPSLKTKIMLYDGVKRKNFTVFDFVLSKGFKL